MEYRLLGRTGVSVSPLCLGTMMFGPWGNDDRADAIRVIHRALDAGINFVDTADVYSGGVSEEIVGEALQGRRDDVVLATKFFVPVDDRPNHSGGSRKWVMQEVENSLRRLAWAINHPGVTSAIIGPRTMEQLESQLPSVHVTLDTEILDRIDELVAPGVTLNADDNSYGAAELTPQARRR